MADELSQAGETVEVRDNSGEHRFEILAGGKLAGFSVYVPSDGPLRFVHTEIAGGYEGRGLASTLIRGVLDTMRARGRQVLPECPFVRSYIERHPAYLDMVPAGERGAFGLPEVT